MYNANFINTLERQRRGYSEKLVIRGEITGKTAGDWKVFLSDDENLTQFIKVALNVWNTNTFTQNWQHGM
jgi:hypothetical protein